MHLVHDDGARQDRHDVDVVQDDHHSHVRPEVAYGDERREDVAEEADGRRDAGHEQHRSHRLVRGDHPSPDDLRVVEFGSSPGNRAVLPRSSCVGGDARVVHLGVLERVDRQEDVVRSDALRRASEGGGRSGDRGERKTQIK